MMRAYTSKLDDCGATILSSDIGSNMGQTKPNQKISSCHNMSFWEYGGCFVSVLWEGVLKLIWTLVAFKYIRNSEQRDKRQSIKTTGKTFTSSNIAQSSFDACCLSCSALHVHHGISNDSVIDLNGGIYQGCRQNWQNVFPLCKKQTNKKVSVDTWSSNYLLLKLP